MLKMHVYQRTKRYRNEYSIGGSIIKARRIEEKHYRCLRTFGVDKRMYDESWENFTYF